MQPEHACNSAASCCAVHTSICNTSMSMHISVGTATAHLRVILTEMMAFFLPLFLRVRLDLAVLSVAQ